jgi:hypothetical protein
MLSAVRFFLLTTFAGVLYAANPLVGTWELNTTKSQYATGAPPKQETLVVQENAGQFEVLFYGIAPNASPLSGNYSVPIKGGTGKIEKLESYDGISSKPINDGTRELSFLKGDQVLRTEQWVASKDGKTLTTTVVSGKTTDGKPVKQVLVFDRQ